MNSVILTKNYPEPVFDKSEILRYAGCKAADDEISALLNGCIEEVKEKLVYRVCHCELSVTAADGICDFGAFKTESKNLADNLKDCQSVILFGATLGVEIDRLIMKYGSISPARALMLQALGAERIEALCDAFCNEIKGKYGAPLKPRFSPGYGDLPLETQREIFSLLDCPKRIGLSLNDSLLMSPTKSVTAFVGIKGGTL